MINKFFALLILIFLSPGFILISIIILISDGRPILFKQTRVGKDGVLFTMYKFRTMKNNTPNNIATHLLDNPEQYNTFVGGFLRKYSIDELPQILNIIIGDMKFIGPRPSLTNQEDLIKLRKTYGTIKCLPGVSGWAQVNGRDKNTIEQKAKMESYYMKNKSLSLDLKILLLTIKHVILATNIYPK